MSLPLLIRVSRRSLPSLSLSLSLSLPISRNMASETSNYLSKYSPEKVKQIEEMDTYLRSRHKDLEKTLSPSELDEVRRKRMIYRSKQRGWLEADILLGSWAKENVPKLSSAELDELEIILEEETIDIFNYMSGKDALPPHLEGLKVMQQLKSYSLNTDLAGPSAYEAIKKAANLT